MPVNGYFDTPFGASGDLNPIPDAAQPSGAVSYAQGFPVGYSTPVSSGGLNVPRTAINQALFDVTSALQFFQQGNAAAFITTAMNGGTPFSYAQYARVSLGGVVYKSLVNANQDTPPSSKWAIDSLGSIPINAVTGLNHTFSSTDSSTLTTRSNSGTAMADTLPGTSGALPNGWFAYVKNTDTAPVVIGVGAGGTINQGNLTGSIIIMPGETWFIESQGVGVYNAGRTISGVLHAAPTQSAFKNLAASWASNTTINITADELVLEDTNGNTRKIKNFSQTFNSANAVGTNGGLDTGSLTASTWYYGYATFNASTNTQGCIFSASATSPLLPSGYTLASGPLTAFFSDGSSHFRGFKQYGRDVQYAVGSNLSGLPAITSGTSGSVTTPTYTAISLANFVPTPIAAKVQILSGAVGAGGAQIIFAPNPNYGAVQSTVNLPFGQYGQTSIGGALNFQMLLESSNLYYASSDTSAHVFCAGFTLNI